MEFQTDFQYTDRETKAKYVFLKYGPLLKGNILDVGADNCFLKDHLPEGTHYLGIGLGGTVDREVNLEKEGVPFEDNSFDCVLCLDVLEHLDNIHEVFDHLCRVTAKYLIISLPDAWSDFYQMLCHGPYDRNKPMKFYNLLPDPPEDRHKWFFSADEAVKFLGFRGRRNGLKPVQIDYEAYRNQVEPFVQQKYSPALNLINLYIKTVWAVLKK